MENLKVLHVVLKNRHLCIEMDCLIKVLPLPWLEVVPGAPFYIVGLMNLAGKSVPVLDLCLYLGMNRKKRYSLDVPMVVCSDGTAAVGLIVDHVVGLEEVSLESFQVRHPLTENNPTFKAIISQGTELMLLLDIKNIVSSYLYNGSTVSFTSTSKEEAYYE